jgi:predicted aldo/keto reductase-like oxidoreductase
LQGKRLDFPALPGYPERDQTPPFRAAKKPRFSGAEQEAIFMMKLGFGLMRLPLTDPQDPKTIDYQEVNRLVDRYLEEGFTYFDTAWAYHGEMSESVVRRCLSERHPRESFVVADKMPIWLAKKPEDYPPIFEEQLRRTGLSYFDIYLLHALGHSSYEKTEQRGGFDFVRRMHDEGRIRHLGFSYHDNAELLDRILREHPEMEYVQLQINYADWENEGIQARRCYETAAAHGRKVIVMEPVKGGILAQLPTEAEELLRARDPEASMASWALRFAASPPEVAVVLSGMSNREQLEDNMAHLGRDFRPLSDEERALLDRAAEIVQGQVAIACTGCRYCMEECPQNIDIPDYFALYNDQQRFGMGLSNPSYYSNLTKRFGMASQCIDCGLCETRCPQHLDIRGGLKKVAEVFGK